LPDEEKYVFYNEKRTQTTAMVPAFYWGAALRKAHVELERVFD
jgi:hypothetical protein